MSKNVDDNLTCVVDRFENSQAVLIFKTSKTNSQELVLPKRYLPKDCKEQDIFHVKLVTDELATLEQKKMAEHILNEILNNK